MSSQSQQQQPQQPIGTPRPNPSAVVFVPGGLDSDVPVVASESGQSGVAKIHGGELNGRYDARLRED